MALKWSLSIFAIAAFPVPILAQSYPNCPQIVYLDSNTFDLRGFISVNEQNSVSALRSALVQSRAQEPCSQHLNSAECEATIAILQKALNTLLNCMKEPQLKSGGKRDGISESIAKGTTSEAPSLAPGNYFENTPISKLDVSMKGCPYIYQSIPGLSHPPKTSVCFGKTTLVCGVSGKSNGRVIYDWLVGNPDQCVKGENWVDAETREKNNANIRSTKNAQSNN